MPGPRTNYLRDTYNFPKEFPQHLVRSKEEPGPRCEGIGNNRDARVQSAALTQRGKREALARR